MKFGHLIEYNQRNVFLQKLCRKWGKKQVPDLFSFLKQALYEVKASGLQSSFNVFWYPSTWYAAKTNLRLLIQKYAQFRFFRKGYGDSFYTIFCAWFFKKNGSHLVFYRLTQFHCLIAFTSWDIGQYLCCDCLLHKLWCQRFWN